MWFFVLQERMCCKIEKRNLYDKYRNLTGEYIYANEKIPKEKYILVVIIFIQNSKGQFLIQKRFKSKGGKWATTGGHPKMGEDSITGICTEVYEEIGINITPYKNEIHLFKTVQGENTFCDLYYLKKDIDISKIHLQTEEVDNIKWFTQNEIKKLIKDNKFHNHHALMYNDCIQFLSNQEEKVI